MAKGFLAYGQQVGKLVNKKGLAVSRPRLEARANGPFCCCGSVWSSWPACSITAVRGVCLMRLRASTLRFTSRYPDVTK